MAGKIGVYFDQQNIGGGLDVPALAVQTGEKWGDLTPVVKVVPVLAAAVDEIRADIEAQGLDGVLLCGASPRVDADIYRLPVQVEHVNLREQCVLAYKNPDKSPVDLSQGAPALLTLMARDYINMGVVKLQKSSVPDSAAITACSVCWSSAAAGRALPPQPKRRPRATKWCWWKRARSSAARPTNIPMASPLASPWTDKQPTNLETRIAEVTGNARITVHCNARMEKLEGPARRIQGHYSYPERPRQRGRWRGRVLATGWVPLDQKYLEPMGLGKSPKVMGRRYLWQATGGWARSARGVSPLCWT